MHMRKGISLILWGPSNFRQLRTLGFSLGMALLLFLSYRENSFGQSCFLLNYISVISSIIINKFVKKCQCYYTLSDQSVPLVTVMSVVSLLTKQLWFGCKIWNFITDPYLLPANNIRATCAQLHICWKLTCSYGKNAPNPVPAIFHGRTLKGKLWWGFQLLSLRHTVFTL